MALEEVLARGGRLEDRTALIVGGTGGIGRAAAERFAREGARVVATGRPNEIGRVDRGAANAPGPIEILSLDLEEGEAAVERAFESALEILGGRIDVLLHVAGVSGRRFGDGPLHECTAEGWDRVLEINARGAFLTNRAAVRTMLSQPLDAHGLRGSIANVGSVLDRAPAPEHFGTIAYAASKGALRALTTAAAARYSLDRIRFNLLVPGLIDTPMAARAVNDPGIQTYLQSRQPLASGPGAAEDVAEAALYLCEPASRFVTGAELVVDGGWCVSEGRRNGPGTEAAP